MTGPILLRWSFAAIHLLALGVGLGAIWARGGALRRTLDNAGLRRVMSADAWWGIAALLWLSTGLVRLLAGLEKPTAAYMTNPMFMAKMTLFLFILLLELWPMVTFIRWRKSMRKGQPLDTSRAQTFARISYLQAGLTIAMVFAATAMARGIGL